MEKHLSNTLVSARKLLHLCIRQDKNFNDQQNVENIQIDITKEDEVIDFFQKINNVYGLINNAGIGVFTPFLSRTVKDFKNVLDVNLVGTFLMSREAIKIMIKNNLGKIINIGSIYGVNSSDYRIYGKSGRNNSEVYSITKSGIIMFQNTSQLIFASYNIQINTLSPGGIKVINQMTLSKIIQKNPTRRMGCTKDLLPALDFLLSKKIFILMEKILLSMGSFTKW